VGLKLLKDPQFVSSMAAVETRAWNAFYEVLNLGNKKASNCKDLVEELLCSYQAMCCHFH